jgi:hypothetical protein
MTPMTDFKLPSLGHQEFFRSGIGEMPQALGSLGRGHVIPAKPMQLCPVAAHTNRQRQVSLNSLDV